NQPQYSHVLPALIRRFHEAKIAGVNEVSIWGTGSPLREFLYADDLGEACVFLMQNYNEAQFINVGVGEDISIRDLAFLVREVVGYTGELSFDRSKPDGTPRKLMNIDKLHALGWRSEEHTSELQSREK